MFENCVKNCFFRSKVRSPTVSNYFPLDTFGPSKKSCVARHRLFFKKCGLDKFWPDHVSDCFQMFLTVSDRFHFSERLIGPIPCMEGWSSANPCKSWRWIFFVWPLCAYTAPNIASWPWYPLFPKTPKIPGTREIWCIYIYIFCVCACACVPNIRAELWNVFKRKNERKRVKKILQNPATKVVLLREPLDPWRSRDLVDICWSIHGSQPTI